jgi:hypothetical protein
MHVLPAGNAKTAKAAKKIIAKKINPCGLPEQAPPMAAPADEFLILTS